ncbi:MAG: hypothetical protein AB1649_22185, partial [Chloroflexota bacterium]
MIAKSLGDAIAIFNPREPLRGATLKAFYVERDHNPMERMRYYLLGLRQKPVKVLFSGHRGSGKSTEMNRLAEALKRHFFIVPVELFELTSTLCYQDILMAMALSLYRRAAEKEAVAQSPVAAIQEAWSSAVSFLREKLYGPMITAAVLPEGEVSLKVGVWAAELEAKYTLASSARQKMADYVDAHLDELHEQMNIIAALVEKQLRRPVLFIVEGIDKTDISRAKAIFQDHTNALTAFQAATIYTFPISLAYSPDFNQIQIAFSNAFTLPNIKINHIDGTPSQPDRDRLRQIVLQRLKKELISSEALDALVQASGGVVVHLVRIAQSAAVYALGDGKECIELT